MTNSKRGQVVQIFFLLVALVFLIRLFSIQVLGEEYKLAAEKNIIQPVLDYAYRGLIYDRHRKLLAYNAPIYDLMVIPKAVKHLDILTFCQDFDITPQEFDQALQRTKRYSYVKPSVFIKDISQTTWAKAQDHLDMYSGFFISGRTARQYPYATLANTLGYVGEISSQQLATDTTNYYKQGDLVGISGLEKSYQEVLRGQRGIQYKITDARGIPQGRFKEGALDQLPVPGDALLTTIDTKLQLYGEHLMKNKIGSIIALAPQTGEVLAIVSSPAYDPNLLVGKKFSKHFALLEQNTLAPLFHRSIMAMYPPGSIFKLLEALIGLQEKVICGDTVYACDKKLLNCHLHPSPLSLHKAIKYSCNPYFYHVFRRIINQQVASNPYEDTRIGLEKWCNYLREFGLGTSLGIDLPGEKCGHIPGVQFYDTWYGQGRWKASTIRSLDIGQGELLVTPLQMANLAATIANKGYYYIPHLVKQIGEEPVSPEKIRKYIVNIDKAHFEFVAQAMREGVEGGTSWRARIQGIPVYAKTGTAENPHGEDHAACIAFALQGDTQIALAVYVENAGWGSRAAAAIAGLMIEQYLKGGISRPWIQDYVLKGDFSH